MTEAATTPDGTAPEPATGSVRLRFRPDDADVRVPAGTTIFDAASWHGIAIDSTCGGHGTCRKCRVQVVEGTVPVSRLDARAFAPDELRDGWRLACRARAEADLVVGVPPLTSRPKADPLASPIWVTPQCPRRIRSVSTTAIGQETNVLQNTAMATTSTDISQRISRLLNRLNANRWDPVTTATDCCLMPSHWSGVRTRTSTSKAPPPGGKAERGTST